MPEEEKTSLPTSTDTLILLSDVSTPEKYWVIKMEICSEKPMKNTLSLNLSKKDPKQEQEETCTPSLLQILMSMEVEETSLLETKAKLLKKTNAERLTDSKDIDSSNQRSIKEL